MEPAGFEIGRRIAKRSERALFRARIGRLDLDYFGSKVGERLRRHRGRQKRHRIQARKLDDSEPLERARRLLLLPEMRHPPPPAPLSNCRSGRSAPTSCELRSRL